VSALPRPDFPPGTQRELSDALHELHHRAGWPSLRTLAREAGCSPTTVSAVFSSARLPSWGTLELLVEAMDGDTGTFKDLWLAATTGGPESSYHPGSYNRYFFDAFLPPYEQTAALCGLRFLPPLLLHGAHRAPEDQVQAHVQVFRDRLQSYPDWPELEELEQCPACEVPPTDRPGEPRGAR